MKSTNPLAGMGQPRRNPARGACLDQHGEGQLCTLPRGHEETEATVHRLPGTADKCWCGGRALGNRCLDSEFHDPFATGEPERIEKLYVAGPMSGYAECNYPEFNRVSRILRDAGYTVVNPAEFGEGRHYVDFIREDLRAMLDCHAVALLDHWWDSVGARNEVQVAGVLKMPVRAWAEWTVDKAVRA